MPTTHVEPDSESLLQDIANSVWKSRKVVVITGAGISTNSGIPVSLAGRVKCHWSPLLTPPAQDFRSENGLYSLIQAQFDVAAGSRDPATSTDVDESDISSDFALERPVKRRKTPRPPTRDGPPARDESPREEKVGDEIVVTGDDTSDAESVAEQDISMLSAIEVGEPGDSGNSEQDTTMEDTSTQEHTSDSIRQPPMTEANSSAQSTTISAAPVAASSPLSSPPLRPSNAGTLESGMEGVAQTGPSTRPSGPFLDLSKTPRIDSITVCSSPLSSPPPILLDPYRQPSASPSPDPCSPASDSSTSESEDASSSSTPHLTSQSSFGSTGRASLPNLKGKDLFDAQIWSCPIKTSVFYTFATTLRQKVRAAEPTSSHHFMSILRDSRKLVRCYTQNIDQLEERVGLKTSLELGAGNRYRFSNRTGRRSGAPKGSLGEAESSNLITLSQQGESQDDQPSECKTEDEKLRQSEPGKPDTQQQGGELSQPSGSGVDPAQEEASAPAPAGPNRGVECVYLHGSLAVLRCFQCGRTSQWDEETRIADTMAGRQPDCPHCVGATEARQERGKRALGVGKLRPDIVLYGEEHPHAHLISPLVQHDLSLGPDLLLILGTSMRVHGLKVLVKEFAKAVHDRGGNVVFVNFTKPPDSVWADVIDYWVQWDCDAWVSDLQKRKPALWLPPGATLPGVEKLKAVKAPRRSSTGEAVKRRDSTKAASKRKPASASSSKMGEEAEAPAEAVIEVGQPFLSGDVQDGSTSQEDAPRRKGAPNASAPKLLGAPRVVKERKLNPDAKRPASTRDHKQNGAYLTWKIGKLLREAAYGRPDPDVASSPVAPVQPKPRAKKARKSAPAALGSREPTEPAEPSQVTPTGATQAASSEEHIAGVEHEGATQEGPVHRGPTPPAMGVQATPQAQTSPPAAGIDDSISAAVKNRKRKRNVTWKKINGVETPVSAEDAKEEVKKARSQLHTKAFFKVAPTPQPVPEPVVDRRLPPPQTPPQRNPPRQFRDGFGSAGFVETDAKLSEAWAGVGLPPVVIRPSGRSTPRPKLQPMEPQVSPAPSLEILSPNVGGPVRWRCPPNPFFLSDPLAGQFGWQPLVWANQAKPPPVREETSWNPEEQLRQEAALMLSSMRCQQ